MAVLSDKGVLFTIKVTKTAGRHFLAGQGAFALCYFICSTHGPLSLFHNMQLLPITNSSNEIFAYKRSYKLWLH